VGKGHVSQGYKNNSSGELNNMHAPRPGAPLPPEPSRVFPRPGRATVETRHKRYSTLGILALTAGLLACLACSTPSGRDAVSLPESFVEGHVVYLFTQAELQKVLLQSSQGLAVVCFTSKFCKACGPYSETFRAAAAHFSADTSIRFVAIDIYYDDTVLENTDINIVPTTLIYRNGNKVKELTGPGTLENLVSILEQHL
jgi:hypothetical protein